MQSPFNSRLARAAIVIVALIFGLGMVGAAIAQAISASSDSQDPPVYAPGIAYGVIEEQSQGNSFPELTYPDDNPSQPAGLSPNAPTVNFSYYFVSGAALVSRDSVSDYAYSGLGCAYFTSNDGYVLLNTDLQLPVGSEIKYLRLYYYDTHNPGYITGYISRYPPSQGVVDLVAVSSPSTGQPGEGFVVSQRITQTVDYEHYPYLLIGRPTVASSNLRICGLRVAYYAPEIGYTFMPMVNR